MDIIKALKQDNLWSRLTEQTEHALSSGSLVTLPTLHETYHDQGVNFIVRTLHNLQRKLDNDKKPRKNRRNKNINPFLPYEEELYVGHISQSHACILNKFNVVNHHLLIITINYHSQNDLLNKSDFDALHFCLKQINGLGFYNGGKIAGASQHHKHMQLVPLPLAPDWQHPQRYSLPIESVLLNNGKNKNIFPYNIHTFKKEQFNSLSGSHLFSIYQSLMTGMGLWTSDSTTKPTAPYNFLCTRNWMMIVPRKQESYHGISVNSLGFSGALLIKNQEDMDRLLNEGPMNILIKVCR